MQLVHANLANSRAPAAAGWMKRIKPREIRVSPLNATGARRSGQRPGTSRRTRAAGTAGPRRPTGCSFRGWRGEISSSLLVAAATPAAQLLFDPNLPKGINAIMVHGRRAETPMCSSNPRLCLQSCCTTEPNDWYCITLFVCCSWQPLQQLPTHTWRCEGSVRPGWALWLD
jgi:hypothetical protein